MSNNKSKEYTRKDAIQELWRAGVLDWSLKDVQKKIKDDILNDKNKISVVLCSRRLGKTRLLLTMAIEQCIKQPNSIVKFVFPLQKDAKIVIRPMMREITEPDDDPDAWCPKDVKPEWKEQDKMFYFPNGSVIQMTGSDNGSIDGVRGGKANLCIVDEAGFVSDLKRGIRSVLGPTVKTTGGRIVMASTPSYSANHEFITEFVQPYMLEDRIRVYTMYDNPAFTPEIIAETIAEYPEGENDPDFQREYLCKIPGGGDNTIIPSFTEDKSTLIVKEHTRPAFFDRYVSMDIGFKDLTGVLFGYYDYLNATLVIEDELVIEKMNTNQLAELIAAKEKELYTNPIGGAIFEPHKRVSDTNLIVINDLSTLHNLYFIPTKKDNKQAAINALDIDIAHNRLIINPKCKTLIYHMKFAEWNKQGTEFKRLKDSPNKIIKGGHADLLDALIYMHRNVNKSLNPYPAHWGRPDNDYFHSRPDQFIGSEVAKAFKKLFKV